MVDRDEAQGEPADCLGGVRPEGGVILVQAGMRNVGTWAAGGKGEPQARGPREGESTETADRGGAIRSSEEARENGRSEGIASSCYGSGSTRDGRSPWV